MLFVCLFVCGSFSCFQFVLVKNKSFKNKNGGKKNVLSEFGLGVC